MTILSRSIVWSGLLSLTLVASGAAMVNVADNESLLMRPLHLEEEPPPLRSLRALSLGFGEPQERTREEAEEQMGVWLEALQRGTSFREQVLQVRAAAGVSGDGVLGTFPVGVLAPEFGAFLEDAEIEEVSGVIEVHGALHLIQRVETHAAVRHLFLEGRDASVRERLLQLRAQVTGDVSFRELAREHSAERPSAERGGDYAVFERGPRDTQLKRAAFELKVGELSGPIETPLGWHLLQRVKPEELSQDLVEDNWGRFRAVLITHSGSPLAANPERSLAEALELVQEIHSRLTAGDPFEPIARFSNDDPGGKERSGDLGWVHRRTPGLPSHLSKAFLLDPGEVGVPTENEIGWVIVQRER